MSSAPRKFVRWDQPQQWRGAGWSTAGSGSERLTGRSRTTVELPDWMPAETWGMWGRYRVEIKKPITEGGARLQLGKLARFCDAGHELP